MPRPQQLTAMIPPQRYFIEHTGVRSRIKKLILFMLSAALSGSVTARLAEKDWTFQEMFAKSDLVVIATPIWTKDTGEHNLLPGISPSTRVLGLSTEFEVRLVLKGNTKIKTFVLYHYRLEHDEPSVNGPALVTFNSKQWMSFLLFLVREPDGRYAPVTGQTDPGYFSIMELKSEAE
jgi:hypothetical protein